jgi:hypothetical protein
MLVRARIQIRSAYKPHGAGASGTWVDTCVELELVSPSAGMRTTLGAGSKLVPVVVSGGAVTVAPSRLTEADATLRDATQVVPDAGLTDPLRLSYLNPPGGK